MAHMSKTDYELIASSVRRSIRASEWTEKNQVKRQAKHDALQLVANDLGATLAHQDKNFKRDLFLKDCGITQ